MSLGSVVLNILRNTEPLPGRCAGYGRVSIGLGATAVTVPPALASWWGRPELYLPHTGPHVIGQACMGIVLYGG
ncbi:hypothetical protein GCM10023175_45160 [Pseudonocardia xishanensis]|uniref:MFS transporter n=1 Tax=Pseudonocardia xishanensis TaxID=630995 RepID=A0ABP8RY42_9PSEU